MKTNILIKLIETLWQGKELNSAAKWKVRGAATSTVTAILAGIIGAVVSMGWIPKDLITVETVTIISAAIVAIVNLVLSFLQIATSKKVGLTPSMQEKEEEVK